MSQAITNLPNHVVDLFNENWGHQAQQLEERLKSYVTIESNLNGNRKRYDDFEAQNTVAKKTLRAGATNRSDVESASRWLTASEYEDAKIIDEYDDEKLGALARPDSEILKCMFANFGRQIDDIIIDALVSDSTTKKGAAGTDNATFLETQKLYIDATASARGAANTSASDTAVHKLTLEKLIHVKSLLARNEVTGQGISGSGGEQVYMAVSQSDLDNLLTLPTIQSADYNTVRALVAGEVDSFMGIKFIRTERLSKASNKRTCIAWVPSACTFYQGQRRVYLDVLPETSHARQMRVTMRMGGMRRYDNKVITVQTYAA
jgi:hypothetical protein